VPLRVLTWTVALCLLGTAAAKYSAPLSSDSTAELLAADLENTWVNHLYSVNPKEAAAATQWVQENTDEALGTIVSVFHDPASDRNELRAALKACGLLREAAAEVIPEAGRLISQADLAAESATALSLMGPDALRPLQSALQSDDATVRREALRGIGKLVHRAPIEPASVLPDLIGGMSDPDGGVRAVAATYLGIVKAGANEAVPVLTAALEDPDAGVRLAAATALEAFGHEAQPALPALKKAVTDRNEDVAREAGRALVTISAVR
jgi:HEAT repeat protein